MITLENYKGEFYLDPETNSTYLSIAYIIEKSGGATKLAAKIEQEISGYATASERVREAKARAKAKKVSLHNKPWDDEDTKYLRDNFGKIRRADMAKHLKRKYQSVLDKLYLMFDKEEHKLRYKQEVAQFGITRIPAVVKRIKIKKKSRNVDY